MNDHADVEDAVLRGLADGALELAFGGEWIHLPEGRREVMDDFLLAEREDGIGAREYQRRIGAGNLASYARVLLAGKRRRAADAR